MYIIVVHFIREKPIQEVSETCVTILYLNVKATELYTVTVHIRNVIQLPAYSCNCCLLMQSHICNVHSLI